MRLRKVIYLCLVVAIIFFFSILFTKTFTARKILACANSISCAKDLSGVFNPTVKIGQFMGKAVTVPQDLENLASAENVLGTATGKKKKILVNLSAQKLYAYTQGMLTYTFAISSGKDNPTPIGKFNIWIKLRATDMEGGERSQDTYYNLPNVPYTMYFYNENLGKWLGYGIHGAYWQSEFGKPTSQGCVMLSVSDAATLYKWADPPTRGSQTIASTQNKGTEVVIFGKAPM